MYYLTHYENEALRHFCSNVIEHCNILNDGIHECGYLGIYHPDGDYYTATVYLKGFDDIKLVVKAFNNYTAYDYRKGFKVARGYVSDEIILEHCVEVSGDFTSLTYNRTVTFN